MTWCVGQYVSLMFQDWLPVELGGSAVCVTGQSFDSVQDIEQAMLLLIRNCVRWPDHSMISCSSTPDWYSLLVDVALSE